MLYRVLYMCLSTHPELNANYLSLPKISTYMFPSIKNVRLIPFSVAFIHRQMTTPHLRIIHVSFRCCSAARKHRIWGPESRVLCMIVPKLNVERLRSLLEQTAIFSGSLSLS